MKELLIESITEKSLHCLLLDAISRGTLRRIAELTGIDQARIFRLRLNIGSVRLDEIPSILKLSPIEL